MAPFGRLIAGGMAIAVLTGCLAPAPPPEEDAAMPPPELALFGTGYPNPGDPCRRAGESAFTGEYLDDAADLVGCPPGFDPGLFAFTYAAVQVAERDGWSLFSVPRR